MNSLSEILSGIVGWLPDPIIDVLFERRLLHDTALEDFLALLNQRWKAVMKESWQPCRFYLSAKPGHLLADPVSILTSIFSVEKAISAFQLEQQLQRSFDLPCRVKSCQGLPVKISPHVLGVSNNLLGQGAVLGDTVSVYNHAIVIVWGPMTLEEYLQMLPDSPKYQAMVKWLKKNVSQSMHFIFQMQLRPDVRGPVVLGDHKSRLGFIAGLS